MYIFASRFFVNCHLCYACLLFYVPERPLSRNKARIFLLVDLGDFFFRFRVGVGSSLNFSEHCFLISPEQTVKLVN